MKNLAWSIPIDATLQAVLDDPGCPPLLQRTLAGTLSWQVRNETPIRRALASSRIAPQWVAALLALGATVAVEGKDGTDELPLETVLAERPEGELTKLQVEWTDARWGEAHVARTPADEPIVAAVAVVRLEDRIVRQARVALTGTGPEPIYLAEAPAQLVGAPLDGGRIRAVAEAVEREVEPEGDYLGSVEYRRAMAGVMTRRALEQCAEENQ